MSLSLRRTALQRRTELRRTPLERKKPMRRQAANLRAGTTQRRRDTGPTPGQRALLLDRACGCCEICGRLLYTFDGIGWLAPHSIHHRQPRGMGGTSRPEINSPANLLLLCGDATTPGGCHEHVESNRARAYENGWLVRASADPAEVVVLLEGSDWYRLTGDGHRVMAADPKPPIRTLIPTPEEGQP
jgi:5-methylcytosine-specific restriction enzyme A